jgi:hypothetical protein
VFLEYFKTGSGSAAVSFIALRLIMGAAEHLAVCRARFAAFAPGGYMVSVHFFLFPHLDFVSILADSAKRAVRHAFFLRVFGLLFITCSFNGMPAIPNNHHTKTQRHKDEKLVLLAKYHINHKYFYSYINHNIDF